MLIFLLILLPYASCNKSIEYLEKFGYSDENAIADNISASLKRFQEVFHLEPTGIFDNATLELMEEPRCGNKDVLLPFTVNPNVKWNFTEITWYFYGSTQYNNLIQKAFDVWGKYSNIVFKRNFTNPTIYISFSGTARHLIYSRRDICYYDFDGPGLVLAHAYPPTQSYNQTDIHFDSDENWYYTMDLPRPGNISFFLTLVHEIGHALGLGHSYDQDSIMFPFQRDLTGITSLDEFELSKDDKYAIQFLYGQPINKQTSTSSTISPSTSTVSSSTSTTTTTTVSSSTSNTTSNATIEPSQYYEERDICELKRQINTYLVVNKKIFAFFKEFVWVISLDPKDRIPEEYTRPRKITDWLRFLPRTFTEISAIYQRPNGNIALFTGKEVFLFRFPALSLISKYDIETIVGRRLTKVNAVLSTNLAKTYLIFDEWYLAELNECNYAGSFLGVVASTLYGVPGYCHGAFRYINGMLYFMTDSGTLEYNEFTNAVTRTVSDIFEVLEIPCIRETLLSQLYKVIRYLK